MSGLSALPAERPCIAKRLLDRDAQFDTDPRTWNASRAQAHAIVSARASGGGLSRTADGGMLVNAAWGLGSSIAQGEVTPDRFELSPDGELLRTAVGQKDHTVACEHRRAPATEAVSSARAAEACLTPAQVVEIGRHLRKAEGVIGSPVEIEWALDDEGFKLLQARPLHLQPAHVPDEIWLQHPRLNGHPAGVGWAAGRAVVIQAHQRCTPASCYTSGSQRAFHVWPGHCRAVHAPSRRFVHQNIL